MMGVMLWKASALMALTVAAAAAQPRFEVVSIKVVPPDTPPTFREEGWTPIHPGGQFSDVRANLRSMISFAYDVKDPSTQLSGLPKWALTESYVIIAKPAAGFPQLAPGENREQVRLMLRAMLEDRFHVKVHTESREERLYQLEVGKGGVKMKTVDPPEERGRADAAMGDDGGRMIGKKATAEDISRCLTVFLKRPVVDRTGLKAHYDFDVRWSAVQIAGGPPPNPGLGPEGIALMMSNLESLLGLRLTTTTGSVQFWVVDRAEHPTEN